jgi:two-component system, NtrC family, nitrogen regulation sensor histidine kinase NtrY
MVKAFFDRFKDDRKYFTIVFFIFILLVLSGLISPILINNQKTNWSEKLSENIMRVERNTQKDFKIIEDELLNIARLVKNDLSDILINNNVSYAELVKTINRERFSDYSLEILAPNGKLIAWNSMIAIPHEDIFPLDYPIGETYFFKSDLITYLTVTDTIISESDVFYLICSIPFEKHYTIKNNYHKEINFSKQISDANSVQAETAFTPFEAKTMDGRRYSFELLNNKKNKIGLVTITKPLLDAAINRVNYLIGLIQSIFVFLAIIFLGLGLRKEFRQLKSSLYKVFLLTLYISGFRYLIYQLGFPANIVEGSLSDPSFFSSAFAGGIVRSPIEFFITALFFTILCVKIYQYSIDYNFSPKIEKHKSLFIFFIILFVPLILVFFLGLRGLSASLRSVIFDSTLRYFRDPDVLSDVPALVMNFNVLLLGSSVTLILSVIIVLLFALMKSLIKYSLKKYLFLLFFVFQGAGIIFVLFQKQPLINCTLIIFFITLIFALAIHIYFNIKKTKYAFVYSALCGSIITILLLNYFNLELERESLKTTAVEINRPNDNLFRFMISEVLLNSMRDEKIVLAYGKTSTNYNTEAYILWCQSSLQREAINSSISLLDKKGNPLGQFWSGDETIYEDIKPTLSVIKNDPVIFETKNLEQTSKKILTGIAPVNGQNGRVGYISVSILWDPGFPGLTSTPEFLQSKGSALNSVVDFSQLKIFEFSDSKLVNVYGDIYPSRDQILPIINSDFSTNNDVWLTLNLNEERYLTYALQHKSNGNNDITSVSLLEKKFSWNLFNFFKLFIIQVIFIVILFVVLFISDIKNFRYTFRFQLTIAFLLISLIPVLVLAFYNRQLVEKRSDEAIYGELKERLNYVENHIQSKLLENKEGILPDILESTSKDLGISFAVFDNTLQIFNSKDQYYKAGIFTERINPQVYYNLNYLSFREYSIKENIDKYSFNSFYKKFSVDNKTYIFAVNDAFNKVKLTFSTSDLDVLLFGIYLLAALIIILISTFLADKISSPIRRLTKATMSVAQGDLNISLENNEKGELKNLLDGFNLMTNELKKNQSELAELEREAAWKEMAKQVAHEIKNPLTPMKLSIQQLIASFRDKSKKFDEIFEKVSSTILNQIESLSAIASEFSRFAKMPSYKIEEVDLGSVSMDIINLFIDEAVNIRLEIDDKLPKVSADNSQVRRLLINLIRNSIQAEASEIKLSFNYDTNLCNLLIEDDGKGISPEIRDKIFEQNFTTKTSGMGLGLKLAKRFLDGIDGDIQLIESNKPGTTFKVTFPLAKKNKF